MEEQLRKEFEEYLNKYMVISKKVEIKDMADWWLSKMAEIKGRVIKELEDLKTERPIRSIEDLALSLADFDKLPEWEKVHIKNRDSGFYLANVEWQFRNKAVLHAIDIVKHS